MKLIFAVLDVSLVIKQKVFYIYICSFCTYFTLFLIRYTRLKRRKSICIPNFDEISHSTVEIKLLPVSDDGRLPYGNFTSSFDFGLHVILHPPAKFRSNQTNIGGLLTSYRFLKMAVIESEIYFRVQV